MVTLKIAYWEFDFEAVCPTLDHDLLSQAHIYLGQLKCHMLMCLCNAWVGSQLIWCEVNGNQCTMPDNNKSEAAKPRTFVQNQ